MLVTQEEWSAKATACALMFAISFLGVGAPAQAGNDPDKAVDKIKTATPIKHVIIIVGENHSFHPTCSPPIRRRTRKTRC